MKQHIDYKVIFLFVGVVVFHLLSNNIFQIHFDEAYYWVWSKNLQLSYYDHPPMIAYMIWLTTLFSNSVFCIRLVSVFCGAITTIFIYKSTQYAFGQRAGNIAMILALAWPILEGTFFITTIDSPFLMFWSITIYCLLRGLVFNQRKFIYLSGVSLGLTLLSKYIGVLILPAVLIFMLVSKSQRIKLFQRDVYFALIISMLLFSPVIIWNYNHQWVSFVFQLGHGMAQNHSINWSFFGEYIGGFLGASNPFTSIALIVFVYLKRKQIFHDERYLFLIINFLVIAIFFGYNALYKRQEANWAAPAWVAGIVFVAACLAEANVKWVYRAAIGVILLLFPFVKLPEVFIPVKYQGLLPQVDMLMGQKQLYQQVKNKYWQPQDKVLACNYKTASRAWYYMGIGEIYVLPEYRSGNNYRYWNDNLHFPIQQALYLCDINDLNNNILPKYFNVIESLAIVQYHDNFVRNNQLYVFKLSN